MASGYLAYLEDAIGMVGGDACDESEESKVGGEADILAGRLRTRGPARGHHCSIGRLPYGRTPPDSDGPSIVGHGGCCVVGGGESAVGHEESVGEGGRGPGMVAVECLENLPRTDANRVEIYDGKAG